MNSKDFTVSDVSLSERGFDLIDSVFCLRDVRSPGLSSRPLMSILRHQFYQQQPHHPSSADNGIQKCRGHLNPFSLDSPSTQPSLQPDKPPPDYLISLINDFERMDHEVFAETLLNLSFASHLTWHIGRTHDGQM